MSAEKVTDKLDNLSDRVFGFSDRPSGEATHATEDPRDGEKTETLATEHAPTAAYPVAEEPTEELAAEHHAGHNVEPEFSQPVDTAHSPSAIGHESFPPRPANPPTQHLHGKATETRKPELRNVPEQDFTISTVAGFVGVFALLMMFRSLEMGLLSIIFGATAVYFARRAEHAGINSRIGKTLGWLSFLGGILAVVAAMFFLAVASVVVMVR